KVATDDLGPIPAGATNILVATTVGPTTTVSAAVVPFDVPSIAGTWYINGSATSIAQSGSSLTFTNERGVVASGSVTSSNTVAVPSWSITGTLTLNNDKLSFSNGTIWTRADASPVNIAGTWVINGKATSISQSGANLSFTNEMGLVSSGRFIG